jgi:hypothetical protein
MRREKKTNKTKRRGRKMELRVAMLTARAMTAKIRKMVKTAMSIEVVPESMKSFSRMELGVPAKMKRSLTLTESHIHSHHIFIL